VPTAAAGLALPRHGVPESVHDNGGSKNARYTVEKKDKRTVCDINAASSLGHAGRHYCGDPEATKREQSALLHRASSNVGELAFLRNRIKPVSVVIHPLT
jgi:hypothetical protein